MLSPTFNWSQILLLNKKKTGAVICIGYEYLYFADDWSYMSDDYHARTNTLDTKDDDVEVALLGYSRTEDVCQKYLLYEHCPKGDFCDKVCKHFNFVKGNELILCKSMDGEYILVIFISGKACVEFTTFFLD